MVQRVWLVVAVVAVVGGLTWFQRWNREQDFKPLYSNLAPEDASALTTKLKEGAIEYRLAENGTAILVPSAMVAQARLDLAGQGLPKSGRIGFELFDKVNFGASEFAEQVNYHRAIEGELERSVMSIREVEQARVHLTLAKDSLYTESRQTAKASVLVKLRAGARLSPQNVAAICQLTASAVPELSPDHVTLVDTSGNLLNRPKRTALTGNEEDTDGAIEYRKGVEKEIQNKLIATLEPILGAEHFRVGVSADVDMTSGDQSEEVYDPQKSAVATSQKTEDGPASANASGTPGTASNLPRPTANAVSTQSGSNAYQRKTENVSYQTSRVVKHTKIPQGIINKLSLSVLVDHSLRWEGEKKIIEPPTPEKLKVIQSLVAGTVGVDMNRGDQVVVEAFPFEATLAAQPLVMPAPPPAAEPTTSIPLPPWLQKLVGKQNPMVLAGVAAGAIVLMLAGVAFLILRKRGKKKKIAAEQATAALAQAAQGNEQPKIMTPEEMQRQIEAKMAEQQAEAAKQEAEELMRLKLPDVKTKKTEVLTKHITAETKKNPELMAQVVRSWLNG